MASGDIKASKALWIVALSALAGFAAIYVIGGRSDNNGAVTSSPASAQGYSPPDVGASPSSSFKFGKMAAFVTKKVPEPLPDIAFQDGTGKELKLSSFKGKTVLLNLWATWCAPCREEMPALNKLQAALGSDKFEVVALSLDRQGAEASQKFLTDVHATALKLYVDPTAKQGMALKLIGMPTTILIDRDGQEVGRLAGSAEWDSDEAKALVQASMR